jgi:uncharacterized protein
MTVTFKSLGRLSLRLAFGYVLVCAGMYAIQDHLIFHRTPLNQERVAQLLEEHPGSAWQLATKDGATLRGWLDLPGGAGRQPLLLYFGGNAQEVSGWMRMRHQVPDWAWAALNYRGYGESSGHPSQQALVADAVAEYDALAADPRIDPRRIVVVGRSLGSGVAVQLAARRPVKALLLVTPFDSVISVASERYPFLPVSWLLRHPFDSLALAPSLHQPARMLLAQYDETIPPEHGARLAAAWGTPVTPLMLPGASHEDIVFHPRFWLAVADFLALQKR